MYSYDRLNGEESDVGGFGFDAVGAQDLANLFDFFRSVLVGGLRGVVLHGDVELEDGGVGSGFKLAVGADIDGIGECGDGGMLLRQGRDGEDAERKKSRMRIS